MRENFLHYLWQLKIFDCSNLKTVAGERITLIAVGEHNVNSGPDFFNAKLKLDAQLWAGNIELHVKSSDWYAHNHQEDSNYDNVILHVVWEFDSEIYRNGGNIIPTLELKNYIKQSTLVAYNRLFSKHKKWINCESDFPKIDAFIVNNWLERLYFERLEVKCDQVNNLLQKTANNWDAVLFMQLAKSFGLKVNGESFLSISQSFDFSIVRKEQNELLNLEALFMGQGRLLLSDSKEPYFKKLSETYRFLEKKYKLNNKHVVPAQYFRLRPANFPTIRLSQLASLYQQQKHVFSKVIATKNVDELYDLFSIGTSGFWTNHYTFQSQSQSKAMQKRLTKSFIHLIIINAILPIKYAYAKSQGKIMDDQIIEIIQRLPKEQNTIVKTFNSLKKVANNAMHSQALIQLKNNYCNQNKCLQCAIGCSILSK